MTTATILNRAADRLRNCWRKAMRNPLHVDLRNVALKYRRLYDEEFQSANVGKALGLLLLAQRRGHLRYQQPVTALREAAKKAGGA